MDKGPSETADSQIRACSPNWDDLHSLSSFRLSFIQICDHLFDIRNSILSKLFLQLAIDIRSSPPIFQATRHSSSSFPTHVERKGPLSDVPPFAGFPKRDAWVTDGLCKRLYRMLSHSRGVYAWPRFKASRVSCDLFRGIRCLPAEIEDPLS